MSTWASIIIAADNDMSYDAIPCKICYRDNELLKRD